jgi:phosphate transport system permease protein
VIAGGNMRRRRRIDKLMTFVMWAALFIAVVPLVLILAQVVIKGIGQLSWDFLTQPEPFNQLEHSGGFGAGIRGTIKVVFIGSVMAIPLGILAAVYLTEYGRSSAFARLVRFLTDVMTGIPSIFVGIFIYTLIVLHTGSFSTWAGGLALGVLMLPIVVRTSEEILRLVPPDLREASFALGAPRWKTVTRVTLPAALPGLTTGCLLAVARAAGETAPLLLTAFGNQLMVPWSKFNGPESTLTYQIYQNSNSPFLAAQERAWTGALVLVFGILMLSVAARTIALRKSTGRR